MSEQEIGSAPPAPATASDAPPQELDLAGVRALLVHQINMNLELRGRMMQMESSVQLLKGEVLQLAGKSLRRELMLWGSIMLALAAFIVAVCTAA